MRFGFKKNLTKQTIDISVKIFLGLFLFVALMAIVYVGVRPHRSHLREGDIALRDIYAPFDFTYAGEIDENATEELRQYTIEKVGPIYRFDSSKLVKAEEEITVLDQL